MKTSNKVSAFSAKIKSIIEREKNQLNSTCEEYLQNFENIELIAFSNTEPYAGELKNKIFLTYSDHYRANSGTWMSVGELSHPHANFEDRGYIKGVCTDLEGYMTLRRAKNLGHNLETISHIYFPSFRKSANKDRYINECTAILNKGVAELNAYVEELNNKMNAALNTMTGCSLLYYIREI